MKRWHTPFAVLVVCLLTFGSIGYRGIQHFGKAAYANGTFTPIDLGTTFTPVGISDSGIVAGNINDNNGGHPAIWQSGSFTNLTSPSDISGTKASGISPSGEVVGIGSYTYVTAYNWHAVKWSNGQPSTDLNGAPANSSNNCYIENNVSWTTYASAANDVGDIAGFCDGVAFDTSIAGYWPGGQPDTFTPLPDISNGVSKYQAFGINHNDDMVGWAGVYCPGATCNGQYQAAHAAFWKNGTATDINPSGSVISYANAINDNDLAVGHAEFADGSGSHPYVWDLANNHTYDLHSSMGIGGNASAVNDSGLVIGYGFYDSSPNDPLVFMWKVGDASITDLNSLLPANTGWVLETVVGINSSGQIVGEGKLNGQTHAFLLNPSTSSSYRLSLTPASQTATIRSDQGLVKATLLDGATSAPASNVKLSFRVEAGPNAGISGTCFPSSCTTDANGQVDWGYLGTAIGVDTVQVWMDTNGNGVPDTGEPQTTATVTWIPPAQPQAYVALGDSYSSGEGAPNPNFLEGTDNHSPRNLCHRSTAAYPWLTHSATSNTYPTFVFRACSGAKIQDFYADNQEGNSGEPAQLSWLNSHTRLVTLTVGGNDVDFHDVLQYCATRPDVGSKTCEAKFDQIVNSEIAAISSTDPNNSNTLAYLYKLIKKDAPNAKVLVVGYPRLFPKKPPPFCLTGVPQTSGLDIGRPAFFIRSDMDWFNREGSILDTAIERITKYEKKNGGDFTYVNTYDALNGHELCTGDPYVNRAIIDTSIDLVKLVSWSFHPNISGQAALAAIVESYAK